MAALAMRAEARRYQRYVGRVLGRFNAAVAVSTIEAEELRGMSEIRVHVIPSGVDTEAIRPAQEPASPPRLLFAGTLGYAPNAQGITWFAQEVWSTVRREFPDARLDIVGRDPSPGVRGLGDRDGITVVGPVPEMPPYYADAHVAVVPILTGAGIRVKIIEAMANQRAIVSTSLGWEGLPGLEPGRHLLVADSPADFANATLRLLRDAQLRGRLALEARRLAEERYDWRGLGDEQEAVLAAVLGRTADPGPTGFRVAS
jgi:glycosyltransferase involved in cell wall biosynthesis